MAIRCPACGSMKGHYIDTRRTRDGTGTRRRQECFECEHRFSTLELPLIDVERLEATQTAWDRMQAAVQPFISLVRGAL